MAHRESGSRAVEGPPGTRTQLLTDDPTKNRRTQDTAPHAADQHADDWRDVLGFRGLYQVSWDGRVRSVDRVVECRNGARRYPGVVLRPGRGRVTLWHAGQRYDAWVITLVRAAWGGEAA